MYGASLNNNQMPVTLGLCVSVVMVQNGNVAAVILAFDNSECD
jgi:hypothetical protein